MKDQFADQIRRKLESIEPTFREKDWVQMQHTMRVHGGGVYQPGLPQWVMPTAGGLVVASLATVVYFQYAANEKLQNEVQTLNQTVSQLRQQPPVTEQPPDTVYVTKYIESANGHLPTWRGELSEKPVDRSLRDIRAGGQLADNRHPQQAAYPDEAASETESNLSSNPSVNETNTTSSSSRRNGLTNTNPATTGNTNRLNPLVNSETESLATNRLSRSQQGNLPENGTFSPTGATRTRVDGSDNYGVNNTSGNYRNRASNRTRPGASQAYDQYVGNAGKTGTVSGYEPSVGRQNNTGVDRQGGVYNNPSLVEPRNSQESASWMLSGIDELETLPILVDTAYYREGMVKISRRIRRLLPVIAAQSQTASTTPAASVPIPDWRFRLGVGGNVGLQQYGGGIYSEVRVGSNWIFGVGLTNNRISGETYLTDYKYQERTKRDFRKEYAGGIDPRFDILNITRKANTWQVPITVGYRIQLLKNWSVVPTVGVSLNIGNQEKIAFNYLRPPVNPSGFGSNEVEERFLVIEYPKQYMHTVLSGVNVEKTWQRISVQAGPYMSLPLVVNPKTLNTASGGIRARLFYRF